MWRIDSTLKSDGVREACLCSLPSSAETATHFCKRYTGNRRDDEFEYFQRHASIATQIEHPHLNSLQFYDLGAAKPYLVFDRVDGHTLDVWLNEQSQIPALRQILRIARQLLLALDALHRRGYVHGNIRPEHILVNFQDDLTLVGCGNCEEVAATTSRSRKANRYDAPEVRATEFQASSSQDIYAAGIVLVELLASAPRSSPFIQAMLNPAPFDRPTAGELVRLLQEFEYALHGPPCLSDSTYGKLHSIDRFKAA